MSGWLFRLLDIEEWEGPSAGTSAKPSAEAYDLQELAITVANKGVTNPVHVQFPRLLNLTVVNTDANNALTLNILDGRAPKSYAIGAGASVFFKKVVAQSFWFTGNANTVFSYAASWPQETDPNTLSAQTALAVNATLVADNVGLAKSSQLPVSLDTGNLKVSVEKPLTGGGSVQVHDTGV